MSKLLSAKRFLRSLSLRDLLSLDEYLHDRIDAQEKPAQSKKKSKREVVPGSKRTAGDWTYQLEFVKCGKERCKNDRHGPYWYGYRTSGGRTVSHYFGKKPPGRSGHQAKAAVSEKAKKKMA